MESVIIIICSSRRVTTGITGITHLFYCTISSMRLPDVDPWKWAEKEQQTSANLILFTFCRGVIQVKEKLTNWRSDSLEGWLKQHPGSLGKTWKVGPPIQERERQWTGGEVEGLKIKISCKWTNVSTWTLDKLNWHHLLQPEQSRLSFELTSSKTKLFLTKS